MLQAWLWYRKHDSPKKTSQHEGREGANGIGDAGQGSNPIPTETNQNLLPLTLCGKDSPWLHPAMPCQKLGEAPQLFPGPGI